MIIVSPITVNVSAFEEPLDQFERCLATFALGHHKFAEDLVTDFSCGSSISDDANCKASLAINETRYPSLNFPSFLLIACTCAFFTGWHMVALYLMSSEYARILRCSSI